MICRVYVLTPDPRAPETISSAIIPPSLITSRGWRSVLQGSGSLVGFQYTDRQRIIDRLCPRAEDRSTVVAVADAGGDGSEEDVETTASVCHSSTAAARDLRRSVRQTRRHGSSTSK